MLRLTKKEKEELLEKLNECEEETEISFKMVKKLNGKNSN